MKVLLNSLACLVFVAALFFPPSQVKAFDLENIGDGLWPGVEVEPNCPTPPCETYLESDGPKIEANPFNQDLLGGGPDGGIYYALPNQYKVQESRNPIILVMRLISIALSFVGLGCVLLMLYAGFNWMTAAGNDEKVGTAKKTLKNATIGLILIFMSYSLVWFVNRRIQVATKAYGPTRLFNDQLPYEEPSSESGWDKGVEELDKSWERLKNEF